MERLFWAGYRATGALALQYKFCGVWNEQTNNEFDAKHRGPHKTARYFYVTAVDAKLYNLLDAPTALAACCGFDLCHKYILYLYLYLYKSPRRSSSMVACEYVSRLSV
jgi:hypothetical protein